MRPGALNGADMDEHVLAAVVGPNKAFVGLNHFTVPVAISLVSVQDASLARLARQAESVTQRPLAIAGTATEARVGRLHFCSGQSLLSPHCSRPKQDYQNDRPNNTPADPCDVRMSRLPFENLLMDGHWKCPRLSLARTDRTRRPRAGLSSISGIPSFRERNVFEAFWPSRGVKGGP